MAIATTVNLLQTLNASITGVTSAPQMANYPTVIDSAALPYVLTWPAEAQWHIKGGGYKRQDRVYRIVCFVEPLGLNDIPSNLVDVAALLQRFVNAYISAPNVPQADPPTYQVTIESGPDNQHSDGGLVSNLTFGGKAYHGFEMRVNVRELWL